MSKPEAIPSIAAQPVSLQEIERGQPQGNQILNGRFDLISDLKVRVEARLGSTEISVSELFSLKENSVLTLEAAPTDPIDILLDGKLIARGALVVVGDSFGIRITEVNGAGAAK